MNFTAIIIVATTAEKPVRLSRKQLSKLMHDGAGSAAAVNLLYVSDASPGITRVRKGSSFAYMKNGKTVKDEGDLQRIKSLVLPPAWEKVWICAEANGHLQATGIDTLGRKQYRYHPLWQALRSHTKFFHLLDFGEALPKLRRTVNEHLALSGLPQEKMLAAVVSIMKQTGIRIGNSAYEQLYGSFGLSTLKNRHVKIEGTKIRFAFKGKKGVYQDVALKSRKLAAIIQKCKDIPGKELFQYIDESGAPGRLDSGMVNDYIKTISGGHFTAKDFRTWAGTVHALKTFKELGCGGTEKEKKQNVIAALDAVAAALGNTRTVCRKYYVHPEIITRYEAGTLEDYLCKTDVPAPTSGSLLDPYELVLLKLLHDSAGKATIATTA